MEKDRQISNEKLAALQALLFIYGEPLALKKIEGVLEMEKEDVPLCVQKLKERLEDPQSGLALVSDGEKLQIVTKPEFSKILEVFVKDQLSEDLSPASLETLAIIAYFGPISRSRIEYQRGVNSIFILRNLMLRGLIERYSDPDHPSQYLYKASFDFLKHLGITSEEKLPDYERMRSVLNQFEKKDEK